MMPTDQVISITAVELEFNPARCLKTLLDAEKNNRKVDFLTVPCQLNWRSSFVGSLVMLVGKLVTTPIFPFYGSDSAIDDNLGLQLLKIAVRLGADVQSADGVGQTPIDLLKTGLITTRRENTKFKRYLLSVVLAQTSQNIVKLSGLLECIRLQGNSARCIETDSDNKPSKKESM